MKMLVILTRETANRERASLIKTVEVAPESDRGGILQWATDQLPATVRGGAVLFFSAEPNTIGGE